jgi:hypothetical protein
MAKQVASSKGTHVGKLLVPWRRKVSHAVHRSRGQRLSRVVRHRRRCGDRFLLYWDAFSCHGALHPRHGPQSSPCLSREVPLTCRLHVLRFLCCLGVSLVLYARFVNTVVLPFAVLRIP